MRTLVALIMLVAMSGPAAVRAETNGAAAGVLPLGIPFLSQTCDASNDPVVGDEPWPSDELVIIPLCSAEPDSVAWLDWTPPAGSTAEIIDAVENPIADIDVPSWQYVIVSGNVNSGNLEFSLDEKAGMTLWVTVTDATCDELPAGPAEPCESGPGIGASSWTHAAVLREFTLQSAHLSGDVSACTTGNSVHGCLVGTFGDYAPPTPFTDIGSSSFDEHIAWAWQGGITLGCAPDRFCPKGSVTREQMAAFLVRMFDLPETVVDAFSDDETSTHEDAINRIAAAGISSGCAPDRFCPTSPVTREQMASFIARAAGLQAADVNPFYDDDFRTHEANINRAAAAGITTGCAEFRFCPANMVTREQMVAFLHRVLEPAAPPPPQAPCDRSYSPGRCIPSPPPDLDCADIGHAAFAVRPPDPHGFDPDEDGIGCEPGDA